MFRLFTMGLEQRLFDVAVAVAVLLAVAELVTRIVRQPAKRLSIIQWTLVGGLVLAFGIFCPWNVFSLGIWKSAHPIAESVATSPTAIPNDDLTITVPAETHALMRAEIQKSRRRLAEIRPRSEVAPGSRFDFYSPPRRVEGPLLEINSAPSWMHWVAIIYALGAAGMLCWLAIGQWAVNRLVRRCSASDVELNHMWADLQREMSTVLPSSDSRQIRSITRAERA
jgi:hypothetical protein